MYGVINHVNFLDIKVICLAFLPWKTLLCGLQFVDFDGNL